MYADQEQSNVRRRSRPGAMRTQSNKVGQLKEYRKSRAHPYAAPGGRVGSGRPVVIRASQLAQQQQQQGQQPRRHGVRVTGGNSRWTAADYKEIFGSQGFSPQAVAKSGSAAVLYYTSTPASDHVAKEMDGAQVDGVVIRCLSLDALSAATGVRRNKATGKQQQQQYFWQKKPQQQQQQGGAAQKQGGNGRRRGRSAKKTTDGKGNQQQQQQPKQQQQQQGGGRGGNRSRSSRKGRGRGGAKEQANPEVERSNLDEMLEKYIGEHSTMLS